MRHVVGRSLLTALFLGVLALPAPAGDTIWSFPDTMERVAEARRDAEAMARTFLPGPEDLGEGWYRPWETPARLPGLPRDATSWWRRLEVPAAWGQFFGLDEAEIQARVREKLDGEIGEFLGQPLPPGTPPHVAAMASSKPAFLSLPQMQLRQFTMLAQVPQVLAVSRFQEVGHAVLRARLTKTPEQVEKLVLEQYPELLRALDANLADLSYDEALAAYAREARSVRRHTKMAFVHASPEGWADATAQALPDHAVLTVDVYLLSRDAVGTRIEDVTAENRAAVERSIATTLKRTWDLTQEVSALQAEKQRERLEKQRTRIERGGGDTGAIDAQLARLDDQAAAVQGAPAARPELSLRDLGDNAWILSLEGLPQIQQRKFAGLQARIRNGNAVADVTVRGTYPKARLMETLEYLLGALDERTQLFVEDE